MTVADNSHYVSGTTTRSASAHTSASSRSSEADSSSPSFDSLLHQDRSDSPDSDSSTSPSPSGSPNGGTSNDPGPTAKRKKASSETDSDAIAIVTQSPDLAKAARWILSLSCGDASTACPEQTSSQKADAQPTAGSLAPSGAPVALLPDAPDLKPTGLPLELIANQEGAAKVTSGATQEPLDAAPFAELSLAPTAAATPANRPTTTVASSPVQAPAPSTTQSDSNAPIDSKSKTATASPVVAASPSTDFGQGGESSLDSSADRQKAPIAASKKKDEVSVGPSVDSLNAANREASGANVVTSSTQPGAAISHSRLDASEPVTAPASVPEPTSTENAKPAGSSVGTIELQIKSSDDSSVGLRFVQRQGHIEVQLKSGDQQTVKVLSENLGELKTSLNDSGWDVGTRIQARVTPTGQAFQIGAVNDRSSSTVAELQSSNLSPRFSQDSLTTSGDQRFREVTELTGSSQLPRTEQVSNTQMNRQSSSDSSGNHDQSRPDRDDSQGRNGQQGRNDGAGADSQRQGRRSARDSEAWLESIESNLTRSTSGRVLTGVTK